MINYEKTLMDLVSPMVDEPQKVKIQKMNSINDNEILLYVYATSNDISRLIGRQGNMASSIRQMMSVCSSIDSKRISIKFESY
ncbi:MAG: KH domain-containing protein [Erysipelotrichia bacterium]|nr:KH domain-containing protein [Erysipelotrichia bacterium]